MTDELLNRIIDALEQAGIPYMLTGSHASSYHGTPRSTQDIDIVVAPTPEQIRNLVRQFPHSEYYVDERAALEAQSGEGQFNVIHFTTGGKIDLMIRKSRPFSAEEFERRTRAEVNGISLMIASAEDVIIAKLEWAKLGESHRQIEDAANILRLRASGLDQNYMQKWVRELGLDKQWQAARQAAGV